jgi:hypothetical protein
MYLKWQAIYICGSGVLVSTLFYKTDWGIIMLRIVHKFRIKIWFKGIGSNASPFNEKFQEDKPSTNMNTQPL